jgi:hypothetical protein
LRRKPTPGGDIADDGLVGIDRDVLDRDLLSTTSPLPLIADISVGMDFRCNGSGAAVLRLPRSRHGIRLGLFNDRAAARAAIEEKYPTAPNVIGVIVGR